MVTGNEKALAAGADVSEFTEPGAGPRITAAFRAAFDALGSIPRPVIAAIEGFALGGGFELALACDLRVAGDGARLGFPEILLGIFPGAGGTQRLARIVGPARTKDLVWSGRHVKSEEALALGLVDRVVPAGGAVDAALEWATSLGAGGGGRDGDRQARHRHRLRPSARRWRSISKRRASARCSRPRRTPPPASSSSRTAPAKPPSPAANRNLRQLRVLLQRLLTRVR